MKILFIVPYVPDLVRSRSYNLLRQLARRGHELTLATVWSSPEERESLQALRQVCAQVIAQPLTRWRSLFNAALALPTPLPLQMQYCWQPELARQLVDVVQQAGNSPTSQPFDLVHVEHLRGARFGLHLMDHCQSAPPVVWDSVDSISLLFGQSAQHSRRQAFRWLTRLELPRTLRAETWLPARFQHTLVTSALDQAFLRGLAAEGAPQPEISVLPNGVDCDYFQRGEPGQRQPDVLVVSGKMSYHANVSMVLHLVEHIMPHVWQAQPGARLWIVGKDPTPAIRALHNPPRILVTGTVPDLRPYLQQAAASLAPLTYGAGIQNKVLEAMACATPVVASPRAVSALNVQDGVQALIAQDNLAFADKIISLLSDVDLRQSIGDRGWQYIHDQHDWIKVVQQLEGVYEHTIQRGSAGSGSS